MTEMWHKKLILPQKVSTKNVCIYHIYIYHTVGTFLESYAHVPKYDFYVAI